MSIQLQFNRDTTSLGDEFSAPPAESGNTGFKILLPSFATSSAVCFRNLQNDEGESNTSSKSPAGRDVVAVVVRGLKRRWKRSRFNHPRLRYSSSLLFSPLFSSLLRISLFFSSRRVLPPVRDLGPIAFSYSPIELTIFHLVSYTMSPLLRCLA
ncbi:uncharacterized protein LOC124414144 [Diprion similis]|uniref:uncharacterized protein LOC124414144 n=1 Tax=Diprion similis TaxID=362088 RepID=UPI001EF75FED|nr:uncharacterized protein LOC124414144 [Diprion similis]